MIFFFFFFCPSNLTTFPTSFSGRCLFTWNNVSFVHNLLFPSLFMTVMTECFKILSSMLNVCVLPWFLLFNLTPSATGTTDRDGRKTLGFYRLVRLVASCPSLLTLKYKEIVLFHALICVFGNRYDWLC